MGLLYGCNSSSDLDRDGDGEPDPYGLEQRPTLGAHNIPLNNPTADVGFENAFPNLPSFTQPVFLTHSGDGTDRLFVVEQPGVIKVFDNDPAASAVSVFLDISNRVVSGGEMGMLGLAFDPDYASNGYFYVYYTDYSCTGSSRCSVLSRFTVSGNPDQANAASESVILRVEQPFDNHNGGTIAFGPDGYLYWGLGDGGSAGDPLGHGQNTATLLGSLLRIDVQGATPYRIPADNPYVSNSDGVANEIWAYGLRNPYRFSFDRVSGELWLADVGQNAVEEIDVIQKGGNYGWNWYEGTRVYRAGAPAGNYRRPIYEYDHSWVHRSPGVMSIGQPGTGTLWPLYLRGLRQFAGVGTDL
ncbi:MAG: PQQ-dependent sugar dehydrogenase [Gammaproteobacteria bacterium]